MMTGRQQDGFSLLTVVAVGAVSVMWILALTAAVVPMYQRASQAKYLSIIRSAAEAGLDYVIADLNAAMAAGETSTLDDPTPDGTPVTFNAPASAIGNSGAQVELKVNNIAPPASSSIYDPSWAGSTNYWRVITATASYAGLQKAIRVILKPEPGGTAPSPTVLPYFQFAMFGKTLLTMSGNARSDGYDSRNGTYGATNVDNYAGDVGSNTRVNMSGNARVGGDLFVFSSPYGSTTNVVATASGNAVVNDQLKANGIVSGFTGTPGDTPQSGDNVLATGQGSPRTGDYATPIDASQSNPPPELPPAKTVTELQNEGYQVVTGSITWSSSTRGYVSQPGPMQVADLGASIAPSGNKVLYIKPGNYKISSLSVSGNARIELQPNNDGSWGPVNFYVEGIVSGSNVIQITGNGIVNPAANPIPSNIRFWYNGNKNILLSGNGNLHALVYAPNANIQVSGNGTYFGSMVADTINNSGNGAVHFDKALLSGTQAEGLAFPSGAVTAAPAGWKTRSWQEL